MQLKDILKVQSTIDKRRTINSTIFLIMMDRMLWSEKGTKLIKLPKLHLDHYLRRVGKDNKLLDEIE